MVVGLAQTRAPTLKRARSVHENLTLNSDQGLDRPINLYRDLPVTDDMQTSGMVRQGKSKILKPSRLVHKAESPQSVSICACSIDMRFLKILPWLVGWLTKQDKVAMRKTYA